MAYSTCPGWMNHPHLHRTETRTCDGCDRCPHEAGVTLEPFRRTPADYTYLLCPGCRLRLEWEVTGQEALFDVGPPVLTKRQAWRGRRNGHRTEHHLQEVAQSP